MDAPHSQTNTLRKVEAAQDTIHWLPVKWLTAIAEQRAEQEVFPHTLTSLSPSESMCDAPTFRGESVTGKTKSMGPTGELPAF